VRALVVNHNDDIFAGTAQGGIFRSTDNGESWEDVTHNLPGKIINALVIDAQDHIFASVFMYNVYKSEDNGASWNEAKTGLTYPIDEFVINNLGSIYGCTTFGGVYVTTDNGANWAQINEGLTFINVEHLAVNGNNQVFAGTWGSGIFRSREAELDVPPARESAPVDFILRQNYPNPFNPVTQISFELRQASEVSVAVYNLNGQLVAQLFSGYKSAGQHRLSWDASGMASGVYLIQVKGDGFVGVKKGVLMR
jgi:hypothetical protein